MSEPNSARRARIAGAVRLVAATMHARSREIARAVDARAAVRTGVIEEALQHAGVGWSPADLGALFVGILGLPVRAEADGVEARG
jgi:hypothetical protein